MSNTNTFAPVPSSLSFEKIGLPKKSSIAVVGAGAFGGWTSLYLLRSGFDVTLIDAWGAGNSRSSSGDETRVIRSTYGANEFYFDLNVRALELWREHEVSWNKQLFFNSGVLWFCYQEKNSIIDDSIPFSQKHKMEYHYLSAADLKKRYPTINTEDVHHAWFDPHGGYLKARESCLTVNEAFVREGGKFILASAKPGNISSKRMEPISLSSGEHASADVYVFACGAWLGQLFPELLGPRLTCTKQEVYYFGTPKDNAGAYNQMPVWVDLDGHDFYYGIPSNANRGFKIGVDLRGEIFDPTTGDRTFSRETIAQARKFIAHRFPGLKNAPVVESRVCPYESSSDGNFIFERHHDAENVWILGGGSGHGFKHGPALGELVARTFSI
ncbi:MAG TPA: FAD-dependent oxidoreductase [Cyclobacteriaceae bacterium]|jgi:glycine/D-amino acid oxidase-like deaminating enzyme|nr:FAD-dependent oxidoreductase [Cyclobacteriaceae bacterium]